MNENILKVQIVEDEVTSTIEVLKSVEQISEDYER